MEIAEWLVEARSFFDDPPRNEADTCDLVIRPLLLALGYLPREISREAADQGGKFPDYTLLPNDRENRWYVEAKAWSVQLEDKHAAQAITYAHLNGGRWVALTNGHVWRLYDDQIRGIPAEKLAVEIELNHEEASGLFFRALSKDSVKGELVSATVQRIREYRQSQEANHKTNIGHLPIEGFKDGDANSDQQRQRRYFWHICGHDRKKPGKKPTGEIWWSFLRGHGQISAGFEDQPGDKGEQILRNYQKGDVIIGYIAGIGVVGWGTIEDPQSYRLLDLRDADDVLDGIHRHRLDIRWHAAAPTLGNAISPSELLAKFGMYHPCKTSRPIYDKAVKSLTHEMTTRFGSLQPADAGAN